MLMNRNLKPQKKAAGVNVYKIYLKWIFLLAVVFTYVSVFFQYHDSEYSKTTPRVQEAKLVYEESINHCIYIYINLFF